MPSACCGPPSLSLLVKAPLVRHKFQPQAVCCPACIAEAVAQELLPIIEKEPSLRMGYAHGRGCSRILHTPSK